MKIQLTRYTKTTELVDVALPYYFFTHLGEYGETCVYGKIEADKTTTITLSSHGDDESAEIEVKHRPAETDVSYMSQDCRSNAREYDGAKAQALELLRRA